MQIAIIDVILCLIACKPGKTFFLPITANPSQYIVAGNTGLKFGEGSVIVADENVAYEKMCY